MEKLRKPESGNESPSDLAVVWHQALKEYYQDAGLDLAVVPKYISMTEIMRDNTIQKNFETFRHKGGQVDKLRHIISTNTDLVLGTAKYIANAASAAFPPSSAILTALTLVLKASSDVARDYDKIMAFFDELNGFLERLQMIEQKLPQFTGYRNHLIRVFSAVLKVCGLTTMATKEGRLKRFGKTIMSGGGDNDLSGAVAGLETAMNRLESATGFATLAGVQTIQETTQRTDSKIEQQLGLLHSIDGSLQSSRSENLEWFQGMSAKLDQVFQMQRKTANEAESQSESQNVDPGLKPRAALKIVNRVFPDKNDPTSHRREIQHTVIDGTGEWLMQRQELTAWMNRSHDYKILWLTGQAGFGKSCLALLTERKLQSWTANVSNFTIATLFFKDIAYCGKTLETKPRSMRRLRGTQVCDVLRYLKILLTNTGNAAKVIEHICPVNDGQIMFNESSGWYRKICQKIKPAVLPWLERGLIVGKDLISQEEYAWVQLLAKQPWLITSEMVKGHVRSWLGDPGELITAYKLALGAIDPNDSTLPQFGHYWHALELDSLKQMAKIADATLNWRAHLSIGITLRHLSERSDALRELEIALEMVPSNIEKAVVLAEIVETGSLAVFESQIDNSILQRIIANQAKLNDDDVSIAGPNGFADQSLISEEGVGPEDRCYEYYRSIAQLAIRAIPSDQRQDWLSQTRRCTVLRGQFEQKLGHTERALSLYDEARSLMPNEVLEPKFYYFFAQLVGNELGPEALLEKVRTWNFFELMAWLCSYFKVDQESKRDCECHLTALYKSAKATNNGSYVVQIHEAIIKFQDARGGGTQMRWSLATFYLKYYYNSPQAFEKAKLLLNHILRSSSQIHLATGFNEPERVDQARDQLAELLYEQFRGASKLDMKQQILEEMRKIQEENVNKVLQDTEPSESSTAIIYACMLRKISGNTQFSDVLERLFQGCMRTLSDDNSGNDEASLVLLAKVLGCVPGLGHDARIAFSAKDSILDHNITFGRSDTKHGLSLEDADSILNSLGLRRKDRMRFFEPIPEDATEREPEIDAKTQAKDKAEGNSESEDTIPREDVRLRLKTNERWGDIFPRSPRYFVCSGNSEHVFEYWDRSPIYLCITCIGTYLCAECFEKIQQVNRGDKTWNDINDRRFCGEGHRYIKGPIEGWRGIRDGIIEISQEGSEIRMPFKEWLEDLKVRRWKQAWEAFWKSEDLANVLE